MDCSEMDLSKKSQYKEGAKAYESNKNLNESDCPYPTGTDRRRWWYAGWLDARTEDRHRNIIKKYGPFK